MNFKLPLLALPVMLSFPVGWAWRGLEQSIEPPRPVIRAGGGMAWPGLVDGLRPVVAGACWLRANLAWEKRDPMAMSAWLELTVAADDRPAYFWLNGARMIAYDMPGWKSFDPIRDKACARQALDFLETGLRWRGEDAELLIEMANIHWRRLGDLEMAAACYRRAATRPGAPYYAARIHGELLLALGRPEEALAWLRRVLPTLPSAEASARRAVVEGRIQALEEARRRR